MHFERLAMDLEGRRVTEAVVAEEGVYTGGRVRLDALGRDDVAWVLEVGERALASFDSSATRFALEGAVREGELRYALVDEEGRHPWEGLNEVARVQLRQELDELLSALSGLVEIY